MSIRPAIKDDCAAIAEIYNHAVVHTAAIWNDKTVDTDNRIAWFEARQLAGFPVLVSEENGVITGYSSFGRYNLFQNLDCYGYLLEYIDICVTNIYSS